MHGLGEQVGIKAGGAAKVSYMTLACGLGGCGPRPLLPPRWPLPHAAAPALSHCWLEECGDMAYGRGGERLKSCA